MRAIAYTRYGRPEELQLVEIDRPEPRDGQVLVRVHAAGVNSWDWDLLRGRPFVVRLGRGAFAEYVCAPEAALTPKPPTLSYQAAAAVPQAAVMALQAIADYGKVQPGSRVLFNGAGGGIGTFAVQLAKHAGAEVTAVDRAEKLAMLSSLGVDQTAEALSRLGAGQVNGKVVISIDHSAAA